MSNRVQFAINSQTLKASFIHLLAESGANVDINGSRIMTVSDFPGFAEYNCVDLLVPELASAPIVFTALPTPQTFAPVVAGVLSLQAGKYQIYVQITCANVANLNVFGVSSPPGVFDEKVSQPGPADPTGSEDRRTFVFMFNVASTTATGWSVFGKNIAPGNIDLQNIEFTIHKFA